MQIDLRQIRQIGAGRAGDFDQFHVAGWHCQMANGHLVWNIHTFRSDQETPQHHYWVEDGTFKGVHREESKFLVGEMPVAVQPDEKSAVLKAIAAWEH